MQVTSTDNKTSSHRTDNDDNKTDDDEHDSYLINIYPACGIDIL